MPTFFKNGFKHTDGNVFGAIIVVEYHSASDPSRLPYETTLWGDGDLSCNCRGWATHKHCKHTENLHARAMQEEFGTGAREIRFWFTRRDHILDRTVFEQPPDFPITRRPRRSPEQPRRSAPTQAPEQPLRRKIII